MNWPVDKVVEPPFYHRCVLSIEEHACLFDVTGQLVIDLRAREWCKLPYPNHPQGCPNYGKKTECPPAAPLVDYYFDLSEPHFFIIQGFNLGAHAFSMKQKHIQWSQRQCKNLLYWQNHVNALLRKRTESLIEYEYEIYTLVPEAMGVHVIKTAQNLGIPIQVRPEGIVFKIALLGRSNEQSVIQTRLNEFREAI